MGTNYYAKKLYFGHEVTYHIGKQSAGWAFCFRAQDVLPRMNSKAWVDFLEDPSVSIEDEYGKEVSFNDFIMLILRTKSKQTPFDCEPPWQPMNDIKNHVLDEYGSWFCTRIGEWS